MAFPENTTIKTTNNVFTIIIRRIWAVLQEAVMLLKRNNTLKHGSMHMRTVIDMF